MNMAETKEVISTITSVAEGEEEEDVVDPWTVSSKSDKGVDYEKLISK